MDPSKPVSYVVGPSGNVLTLENLPQYSGTRWTPCRKAELVAAVHSGLIRLGDACNRYSLSSEEFFAWQTAMVAAGVSGLHALAPQPRNSSAYSNNDGVVASGGSASLPHGRILIDATAGLRSRLGQS